MAGEKFTCISAEELLRRGSLSETNGELQHLSLVFGLGMPLVPMEAGVGVANLNVGQIRMTNIDAGGDYVYVMELASHFDAKMWGAGIANMIVSLARVPPRSEIANAEILNGSL